MNLNLEKCRGLDMDVEPPDVLKEPLVAPSKILMGAGPSNCSSRVLEALGQPVIGHLHKECIRVMDDVKEGIKYIFQTRNELTLALSASGHGGMEAVLCNLLEKGNKVLIAVNGIWGERAANIAIRHGAIVVKMIKEPGNNFQLKEFEEAVTEHKPDLLFVVQGESSTGVYQPIEGLGDICHKYNCMLAVDVVASLGSVPLFMDRWGIDAIYSGSQKVLGAPAGITPISLSARAQKKLFARKTETVYYFDLKLLGEYWGCFGHASRLYHHTISTTLLYGLREALAKFAEEGYEKSILRYHTCAKELYRGLPYLGLQPYVQQVSKRLPTVTTILIPKNINWRDVADYAMDNYSLEISGGLGPTADKVFRVGLMSYNANQDQVKYVLEKLGEAIEHSRNKTRSKL